jgi:hypothetical protein
MSTQKDVGCTRIACDILYLYPLPYRLFDQRLDVNLQSLDQRPNAEVDRIPGIFKSEIS